MSHSPHPTYDMQLPRFTWKSALLYLVGVAAILLIVYLLIALLFHATPHQRINLQKSQSGMACVLNLVIIAR